MVSKSKGTTKCIWKPDPQSLDEYIVIVGDVDAYKKWKEGDTTVPLVEVVDAFEVFVTGQGKQGVLDRPSNQILDAVFATTSHEECVKQILAKGVLQVANDASAGKYNNRREESGLSRGSHSGGR